MGWRNDSSSVIQMTYVRAAARVESEGRKKKLLPCPPARTGRQEQKVGRWGMSGWRQTGRGMGVKGGAGDGWECVWLAGDGMGVDR